MLDSGHCPAQKNVVKNVNIPARINLLLRPQNEVLSLLLGGIESPLRQKSINSVFSAQKWIQELINGMFATPFCQCERFHVERDAVALNPEAADAVSSSRYRQHQPLGPVRRVKLTNIV